MVLTKIKKNIFKVFFLLSTYLTYYYTVSNLIISNIDVQSI